VSGGNEPSEAARLVGELAAKVGGACELGRRVGTTEGMVRHLVKGRRTPSKALRETFATLGIPDEAWVDPAEEPKPKKPSSRPPSKPVRRKTKIRRAVRRSGRVATMRSVGSRQLGAVNMTQRQIAARIGVSLSTVCSWISGQRIPNEAHRRAMRAAFGIPLQAWPDDLAAVRHVIIRRLAAAAPELLSEIVEELEKVDV
jgi:transcriptional regulator with XRE-family HTH domain